MDGTEASHLDAFDDLDFKGWNGPDWDVFRHRHTDDVIVEMMGKRTTNLDDHVALCEDVIKQNPKLKIEDHPIKLAEGEWTAVMGNLPGGRRMVTVAKWRDGAISEEYVFFGE
jgi:hypothetical protein